MWVNPVHRWFVINGIDRDSAETLKLVRFKYKESAMTTFNYFRRGKYETTIYFTFILVLHDSLIPSTSNNLLYKRWETANPYIEVIYMGIKKFSTWLI